MTILDAGFKQAPFRVEKNKHILTFRKYYNEQLWYLLIIADNQINNEHRWYIKEFKIDNDWRKQYEVYSKRDTSIKSLMAQIESIVSKKPIPDRPNTPKRKAHKKI